MFVFAGFKCQMRVCQLENGGQYMLVGVMNPRSLFTSASQAQQTREEKWSFLIIAQRAKLLFSVLCA